MNLDRVFLLASGMTAKSLDDSALSSSRFCEMPEQQCKLRDTGKIKIDETRQLT
jgi:hypothetical protein